MKDTIFGNEVFIKQDEQFWGAALTLFFQTEYKGQLKNILKHTVVSKLEPLYAFIEKNQRLLIEKNQESFTFKDAKELERFFDEKDYPAITKLLEPSLSTAKENFAAAENLKEAEISTQSTEELLQTKEEIVPSSSKQTADSATEFSEIKSSTSSDGETDTEEAQEQSPLLNPEFQAKIKLWLITNGFTAPALLPSTTVNQQAYDEYKELYDSVILQYSQQDIEQEIDEVKNIHKNLLTEAFQKVSPSATETIAVAQQTPKQTITEKPAHVASLQQWHAVHKTLLEIIYKGNNSVEEKSSAGKIVEHINLNVKNLQTVIAQLNAELIEKLVEDDIQKANRQRTLNLIEQGISTFAAFKEVTQQFSSEQYGNVVQPKTLAEWSKHSALSKVEIAKQIKKSLGYSEKSQQLSSEDQEKFLELKKNLEWLIKNNFYEPNEQEKVVKFNLGSRFLSDKIKEKLKAYKEAYEQLIDFIAASKEVPKQGQSIDALQINLTAKYRKLAFAVAAIAPRESPVTVLLSEQLSEYGSKQVLSPINLWFYLATSDTTPAQRNGWGYGEHDFKENGIFQGYSMDYRRNGRKYIQFMLPETEKIQRVENTQGKNEAEIKEGDLPLFTSEFTAKPTVKKEVNKLESLLVNQGTGSSFNKSCPKLLALNGVKPTILPLNLSNVEIIGHPQEQKISHDFQFGNAALRSANGQPVYYPPKVNIQVIAPVQITEEKLVLDKENTSYCLVVLQHPDSAIRTQLDPRLVKKEHISTEHYDLFLPYKLQLSEFLNLNFEDTIDIVDLILNDKNILKVLTADEATFLKALVTKLYQAHDLSYVDAAKKIIAFAQQKQKVLDSADPITMWRYFQLAQLGYNVLADLQSLGKIKATEVMQVRNQVDQLAAKVGQHFSQSFSSEKIDWKPNDVTVILRGLFAMSKSEKATDDTIGFLREPDIKWAGGIFDKWFAQLNQHITQSLNGDLTRYSNPVLREILYELLQAANDPVEQRGVTEPTIDEQWGVFARELVAEWQEKLIALGQLTAQEGTNKNTPEQLSVVIGDLHMIANSKLLADANDGRNEVQLEDIQNALQVFRATNALPGIEQDNQTKKPEFYGQLWQDNLLAAVKTQLDKPDGYRSYSFRLSLPMLIKAAEGNSKEWTQGVITGWYAQLLRVKCVQECLNTQLDEKAETKTVDFAKNPDMTAILADLLKMANAKFKDKGFLQDQNNISNLLAIFLANNNVNTQIIARDQLKLEIQPYITPVNFTELKKLENYLCQYVKVQLSQENSAVLAGKILNELLKNAKSNFVDNDGRFAMPSKEDIKQALLLLEAADNAHAKGISVSKDEITLYQNLVRYVALSLKPENVNSAPEFTQQILQKLHKVLQHRHVVDNFEIIAIEKNLLTATVDFVEHSRSLSADLVQWDTFDLALETGKRLTQTDNFDLFQQQAQRITAMGIQDGVIKQVVIAQIGYQWQLSAIQQKLNKATEGTGLSAVVEEMLQLLNKIADLVQSQNLSALEKRFVASLQEVSKKFLELAADPKNNFLNAKVATFNESWYRIIPAVDLNVALDLCVAKDAFNKERTFFFMSSALRISKHKKALPGILIDVEKNANANKAIICGLQSQGWGEDEQQQKKMMQEYGKRPGGLLADKLVADLEFVREMPGSTVVRLVKEGMAHDAAKKIATTIAGELSNSWGVTIRRFFSGLGNLFASKSKKTTGPLHEKFQLEDIAQLLTDHPDFADSFFDKNVWPQLMAKPKNILLKEKEKEQETFFTKIMAEDKLQTEILKHSSLLRTLAPATLRAIFEKDAVFAYKMLAKEPNLFNKFNADQASSASYIAKAYNFIANRNNLLDIEIDAESGGKTIETLLRWFAIDKLQMFKGSPENECQAKLTVILSKCRVLVEQGTLSKDTLVKIFAPMWKEQAVNQDFWLALNKNVALQEFFVTNLANAFKKDVELVTDNTLGSSLSASRPKNYNIIMNLLSGGEFEKALRNIVEESEQGSKTPTTLLLIPQVPASTVVVENNTRVPPATATEIIEEGLPGQSHPSRQNRA